METVDSFEFERWSRTRLNRIIADYLLRQGYNESAEILAANYGIKEFVDLELFADAREIEDAIRSHSCTKALEWCEENKLALAKIKVIFVALTLPELI